MTARLPPWLLLSLAVVVHMRPSRTEGAAWHFGSGSTESDDAAGLQRNVTQDIEVTCTASAQGLALCGVPGHVMRVSGLCAWCGNGTREGAFAVVDNCSVASISAFCDQNGGGVPGDGFLCVAAVVCLLCYWCVEAWYSPLCCAEQCLLPRCCAEVCPGCCPGRVAIIRPRAAGHGPRQGLLAAGSGASLDDVAVARLPMPARGERTYNLAAARECYEKTRGWFPCLRLFLLTTPLLFFLWSEPGCL